jgi:dTDP-4-dehydrorhamnose 3,5-epimerase
MELIDGVVIRPQRLIPDDRGFLMEMLRSDWPEFKQFGQAYVTACYPGIVKAWHYHTKQWDHFSCVAGTAKVVLYDARQGSPTHGRINEFHIGPLSPRLVSIPPLVYHGFTAVGIEPALIINIPTELYNHQAPDEHHLPFDDPSIPYSWLPKSR